MERNLQQTGVVQVDGAWATRITFSTPLSGPTAGTLELRFLQDRTEVVRATLDRATALEILGERNLASIDAQIAQANKEDGSVKGELKGRTLSFRAITLPGPKPPQENAIEAGDARTPTGSRKPKRSPRNGRGDALGSASTESPAVRHSAPLPVQAVLQAAPIPAPPQNETPTAARPAAAGGEKVKAADSDEKAPKGAEQTAEPVAPDANPPVVVPVPAHIAARYQVKDNRYHFDDQTVAFVDRGTRLTAETENKAVLRDLIAIAEVRGWQTVTVRGTASFRRAAWREAAEAGLKVNGYKPTERELTAANAARDRQVRPGDAPRADLAPTISGAAERTETAENGREAAKAEILFGKLVTHGAAPYRDDPQNGMSYFVTIQDLAGNLRTQWGVGFREAMQRATTRPQPGDAVGLERVGSTPVSLVMRKVDANGELVTQQVAARRHHWLIEKAEYFEARNVARQTSSAAAVPSASADAAEPAKRADQTSTQPTTTRDRERAAAIRSATMTREELQLQYPDINRAVFAHMDAQEQFADAFVKAGLIRESDRKQVIAQMRERLAGQVESGAPIAEPDNKKVATLISRSVRRVANEIGRTPVEITSPRAAVRTHAPRERGRDDPAVRA